MTNVYTRKDITEALPKLLLGSFLLAVLLGKGFFLFPAQQPNVLDGLCTYTSPNLVRALELTEPFFSLCEDIKDLWWRGRILSALTSILWLFTALWAFDKLDRVLAKRRHGGG